MFLCWKKKRVDTRTLDARTLDARSTLVAVGYMKGGLLDRRTLDSAAAQCRRREMRLAADLLKRRARARWPPRLSVQRCEAGEVLAVRVPGLGGAIPRGTIQKRRRGTLEGSRFVKIMTLAKRLA